MMLLKILLMHSLTLSFAVRIKYPTREADAENQMLDMKRSPKGVKSREIYSMLQAEHDKLVQDDYIFLGWRGIAPSNHWKVAGPNGLNVDDYLRHNNPKDPKNADFINKFNVGKEWQGLWLATFVDVCYGYVYPEDDKRIDRPQTYLPWIFRVYLKRSDIEKVNDVKMWQDPNTFKPNPQTNHIYYGKESLSTPTNEGFEMVLSPSVAQKARFLLSTFTAIGYEVFDQNIRKGKSLENKGELNKRKMRNSVTAKGKLVNSENRFKV